IRLAATPAVRVGGIEEVDALVPRAVHQLERLQFGFAHPEERGRRSDPTEVAAAQPEPRDFQACRSQPPVFHVSKSVTDDPIARRKPRATTQRQSSALRLNTHAPRSARLQPSDRSGRPFSRSHNRVTFTLAGNEMRTLLICMAWLSATMSAAG